MISAGFAELSSLKFQRRVKSEALPDRQDIFETHIQEFQMAIERTLSIIKPDAVAKNVIGQIYARFEAAGPEGHCRPNGASFTRGKRRLSTLCTKLVLSSRIWSISWFLAL
jgi:hypothetical protein